MGCLERDAPWGRVSSHRPGGQLFSKLPIVTLRESQSHLEDLGCAEHSSIAITQEDYCGGRAEWVVSPASIVAVLKGSSLPGAKIREQG